MRRIQATVPFISTNHSDGAFEKNKELHKIYLENAKTIIFSSSYIEEILARGIGRYFFGEEAKNRMLLDDLIISTDSFSFSAKRRTFVKIVTEQKILQGQEISKYEKLIASIICYRNMFTHGTPLVTKEGCVLHYFEGRKIEKLLTGELLEKIESDLNKCSQRSQEIMLEIRKVT